jgi:hypothetical protein
VDVMVRIAPNLEVRVARRAIGGFVQPEEREPEPVPEPEPEPESPPPE